MMMTMIGKDDYELKYHVNYLITVISGSDHLHKNAIFFNLPDYKH